MRILFITKQNETYGFNQGYNRKDSGLYNSTRYIVKGLVDQGIDARIVGVIDNNCIDREVSQFKPQIVVLEALWVVPEKFDILKKLHPSVKWFVHLHSNMPFLAQEGIATQWIQGYIKEGIGIIVNSPESYRSLEPLIPGRVFFLPNVYSEKAFDPVSKRKGPDLHIGCFGAVRPMKNQLIQAMAAIRFAQEIGRRLFFHVNGSRVETDGGAVLKNLQNLFANGDNQLVMNEWFADGEFIPFLNQNIDLGMQVSLSETFNVVTANYVTAGLPIVVSNEIKWVTRYSKAPVDDIARMVERMRLAWRNRMIVRWNQKLLAWYGENSLNIWVAFVKIVTSRPLNPTEFSA